MDRMNEWDLCMCRPAERILLLDGTDQSLVGPSESRKALILMPPNTGKVSLWPTPTGLDLTGLCLKAGDRPLVLDRAVVGQLVSGAWTVRHTNFDPQAALGEASQKAATATDTNASIFPFIDSAPGCFLYITHVDFSYSNVVLGAGALAALSGGALGFTWSITQQIVIDFNPPLRFAVNTAATATLGAGGVNVTGCANLYGYLTPVPQIGVIEILV